MRLEIGRHAGDRVRKVAGVDIFERAGGLRPRTRGGAPAGTGGNVDGALTRKMWEQKGYDGGSVTLLKRDGSPYPGSPFTGRDLPGP
jgi:hypothetical protein